MLRSRTLGALGRLCLPLSLLAVPVQAQAPLDGVRSAGGDFGGCLDEEGRRGRWSVRYTGYGCVRILPREAETLLALSPDTARGRRQTHAALALGPAHGEHLDWQVRVRTVGRHRQGAPPNEWEVGWVVWSYRDDAHFYYFIAKPNGWELGKRDPAYPGGQRFLATGSAPRVPIGREVEVEVEQRGDTLRVALDGVRVSEYVDRERSYRGGRLGVYTEDAAVRFRVAEAQRTRSVSQSSSGRPEPAQSASTASQ